MGKRDGFESHVSRRGHHRLHEFDGKNRIAADPVKRHDAGSLAIEGYTNGHWVLMDYGDVIIHVFYEPVREFYDLERLWSRAPRPPLPEPYLNQTRNLKTGTESL